MYKCEFWLLFPVFHVLAVYIINWWFSDEMPVNSVIFRFFWVANPSESRRRRTAADSPTGGQKWWLRLFQIWTLAASPTLGAMWRNISIHSFRELDTISFIFMMVLALVWPSSGSGATMPRRQERTQLKCRRRNTTANVTNSVYIYTLAVNIVSNKWISQNITF